MSCLECEYKCKYNEVEEICENCSHDYELIDKIVDSCDDCDNGDHFEYRVINKVINDET